MPPEGYHDDGYAEELDGALGARGRTRLYHVDLPLFLQLSKDGESATQFMSSWLAHSVTPRGELEQWLLSRDQAFASATWPLQQPDD